MKTLFMTLLLVTPALAEALEVIIDDATGAIVSTISVAKTGDHGHGDRTSGRTCAWFDGVDHPTGAFDADNVPQLRILNGKIRARPKSDIDADVTAIRRKAAAAARIAARMQRLAAEAALADSPGDPDLVDAVARARAAEAAGK